MNQSTRLDHVSWSRNACIYEVNIRQFTPEGTFTAFEAHLPRLAAMGVGILWFMPIQPIGTKERKGSLGSYYAIRDYCAVNPEFGTLADFKRVVAAAHALGMKVILDWVANHTAWDHAWATEHPDWYKKDERGQIHAYTYREDPTVEPEYWTDVIGLDYANRALWPAMSNAMLWWMREAELDGFRCDVASLVPTAFWEQLRPQLQAVRPVFMLAESQAPELHRSAFDMTYDWELWKTLVAMAAQKAGPAELQAWWQWRQANYAADDYGMNFTANHDSNSWKGSDAHFFGAAFQAMAVVAATVPGMPLIYGGQEAGLNKQIAFFEKDAIEWRDVPLADFCAGLLRLKREHPALANGAAGGELQWHSGGNPRVLAYSRVLPGSSLRVAVNLSDQPQQACDLQLAAWGWHINPAPPMN
jgi:glycosidase